MSDSQMDCTAVWPSQVQYVDAGERTLLYRSRRGCVYRVFSKERNEWLVLKEEEVLEPNNLVRAVTAVQSLQSQFLLYHYSVRVQDGRMAALLMEQMDFTLRDVLAVQSRLAEAQVRAIALVALNALADLHERAGMVHGDLSPANIFFRRTGEMRLGDFSSAVPIDAAVEYFASTVLYSPVEALRNRQLVSRPSSDIWALGVVLNHCVSGERHPFVAAGASDFWKFLSELAEAEEETRRLQLQTHISAMRFINQAASDRAVINAGGRRFETLFSTLHRYPDTPFAQLFPLPGRGARQHRGREFFLDVTPHVFEYILGFLRTNQLNLPAENLQIRAEVVYSMNQWGLLEHAFPPEVIEDGEGCSTGGAVVKLPDVCVVQVCDHMQHDQGVKRHALTITYGADGFQLRSLIRRVRRDLERQLSSTYWQCYQTNERAAFFVTTKVANGTADLLTTSVTQQLVEHTESMGYSLASSYVTLSPDVVHTSVRMLIHNFTFRRSRRVEVEPGDGIALGEGSETIEAEPNIPTMHVGPRREPLNAAESIPPRNERAVNIWTVD